MKRQLIVFIVMLSSAFTYAQEYELKKDIFYRSEKDKKDAYMDERCRLDLYYPTSVDKFPTIIWFHGGGITGGNKHLPDRLMNQEVAIVAVNYRLSPKVKAPA
ncbi:MAG: carboxylesterase family protein, partial [Cyclobacteriaceae bacterium]